MVLLSVTWISGVRIFCLYYSLQICPWTSSLKGRHCSIRFAKQSPFGIKFNLKYNSLHSWLVSATFYWNLSKRKPRLWLDLPGLKQDVCGKWDWLLIHFIEVTFISDPFKLYPPISLSLDGKEALKRLQRFFKKVKSPKSKGNMK